MLTLYNLHMTGANGKLGYFRWREHICSFIDKHWTSFFGESRYGNFHRQHLRSAASSTRPIGRLVLVKLGKMLQFSSGVGDRMSIAGHLPLISSSVCAHCLPAYLDCTCTLEVGQLKDLSSIFALSVSVCVCTECFWHCRKRTATFRGTVAGALSSGCPLLFRSGTAELKENGWWTLTDMKPPSPADFGTPR